MSLRIGFETSAGRSNEWTVVSKGPTLLLPSFPSPPKRFSRTGEGGAGSVGKKKKLPKVLLFIGLEIITDVGDVGDDCDAFGSWAVFAFTDAPVSVSVSVLLWMVFSG